jgi:hypothetical protein
LAAVVPSVVDWDPDPQSFYRLDPDPELQKLTHKSEEITSFEVLDVLFCGMKTSPVAWSSMSRTKEIAIFLQ